MIYARQMCVRKYDVETLRRAALIARVRIIRIICMPHMHGNIIDEYDT